MTVSTYVVWQNKVASVTKSRSYDENDVIMDTLFAYSGINGPARQIGATSPCPESSHVRIVTRSLEGPFTYRDPEEDRRD